MLWFVKKSKSFLNLYKKALVRSQKNMEQIRKELRYVSSRSSGSGGQHVNKVSSRVTLKFDLESCPYFSDEEKEQIKSKMAGRIGQDGIIQMSCDTSRSQLKNKKLVTARFFEALASAIKKEKIRKECTLPPAIQHKRKQHKMAQSQKKDFRKKISGIELN